MGALLGKPGVVASTAAASGDLAVDGAAVAAKSLRNSANGKALGDTDLNLVSCIRVEVFVHVMLNLTVVGQ